MKKKKYIYITQELQYSMSALYLKGRGTLVFKKKHPVWVPTETQDSTTAVLRRTAAKFVEMNTGNLHVNGIMLMTEVKIKDNKTTTFTVSEKSGLF